MWGTLLFGFLTYALGVSVGAATVGVGALVWRKYGKAVAE